MKGSVLFSRKSVQRLCTLFVSTMVIAGSPSAFALTEWTIHKTSNGAHPDGREQQMLWLINRARQNPVAEGQWLASSNDPDVANGRRYFGVNTTALRSAFNALSAKPPAAFDRRLYSAAIAHSNDLIRRDAQDHDGQIDRVRSSGYNYRRYRGNVFSYAENALNAHAAFNIDWGIGPNGMQNPAGHRLGIMAIDSDYSAVGISAVAENNSRTETGPWVVTQNFGYAIEDDVTHFNEFVVGTVWQDKNNNNFFDPGEGISGVTVSSASGEYYATTSAGGGYAFPIDAMRGSITIEFTGGGVAGYSRAVNVGSANNSVLVDYVVPNSPAEVAVSPDRVRLQVNTPDDGAYGRSFGSDRNPTSLNATFTGTNNDLMLSVTGYDIDSSTEVVVRLNGTKIGNLRPGTNLGLTDGNRFSIPAMFQKSGTNVIEFYSESRRWGVTDILLENVSGSRIALPQQDESGTAYGWKFGGYGHRTVIRGSFYADEGKAHYLVVSGYNIIKTKTVAVYANGVHLGYLEKGRVNEIGPRTVFLLKGVVVDKGYNEVEFHFLRRPDKPWGILEPRVKPKRQ